MALRFLKKLNLSRNSIYFVWDLPVSLEQLNISENLIGTLDPVVPRLVKLQSLNLAHNHLSSVKSLSCIPHLKVLNISYNRLKTTNGLEGCSSLTEVDLESNDLETLTEFYSSTSLKLINLKNNPCVK